MEDETPELIETDDKDEGDEPGQSPKRVHTANIMKGTPEDKPDWIEEGEQGHRLRTEEQGARIQTGDMRYVPAVLNGFPTALLYDTGASVCTIGKGTIKRMGLDHLVYPTTKARCWTANGECQLDRAIQLEMMILGATRKTQFMITPQEDLDNTPLLGTPVTNPSNKELEGPAWETRTSKNDPNLSTAWKGGRQMTYLYKEEHMARKAANWLAANHVTPATQVNLSIKRCPKTPRSR